MKLTMAKVRQLAWKILTHPDTRISFKKHVGRTEASSEWDTDHTGIKIFIDKDKTEINKAAIHEILHKILDPHTTQFCTYALYEIWYNALEEPFFERMSSKTLERWHNAINNKIKKGG